MFHDFRECLNFVAATRQLSDKVVTMGRSLFSEAFAPPGLAKIPYGIQ
jgi:hypothetical protein